MTAETQAISVLLNDAGVGALVSNRIYPGKLEQTSSLPAVVFQRSGTAPVSSVQGDSGLDQVRLQFDCYAKTPKATGDVSAAIRAAFKNNPKILYIDERDFGYEDETETYRRMIEFYFWV